MKRISTLILTLTLLLLPALVCLAATPTIPSSNFIFSNWDGNRFTIRFTAGNGSSRIVVMKAGSAVTGIPVDGADYTANAAFGTPNTAFTAAGEYVVYKGAGNTFTVTGLQPATTYHLAVFDFNGAGTATQYLVISLNGSTSTVSAPTNPAYNLSVTNITGNSMRINWQNGNGTGGRIVVARKANAVNALPADLTDYSYDNNFGAGPVINTDNYVVFKGNSANVTVSNLEPGTQYHFSVFEKNGSSAPVYLTPGAVTSATTANGPSVPAGAINFNNREGNRFSMTFSSGNGSRRLVIMKKGSAVTAVPASGTAYTASPVFGSGDEIANGEYVVGNMGINSLTVTNLEPSSVYHIRIYEFDVNSAGHTFYLTSASTTGTNTTATVPATQTSAILFENVTGTSMTIKYTAGSGDYRMMIMKEGSAVDALPADLTRYNGNTAFRNGFHMGNGNYVITGGVNGTQINVSNLTPGATYHVAMHEFHGNNYPVYKKPAATATITIPAEPASPSANLGYSLPEGNSIRATWTNGSGSGRIAIARKGAPVTARPVDGTSYTPDKKFGHGQEIAPGEFVIYNGVNNNTDLEQLESGTTYHVAVFEYNLSGTSPDYLTTSFLAGTLTTLSAPVQQVSNIIATAIQATQATFSFTAGSGSAHLFVMRAGSPVNAEPADFTSYSSSQTYGVVSLGTGNYIVLKTSSLANFTVTSLAPNTTYHIAAFSHNGSSGPVFLRPGAVYSFTTTAGGTAPAIPSTAAAFSATDGNKFTFSWTKGNGQSRIVVARKGSPVTFVPADGAAYAAAAAFGAGTDLGGGQYVVYNSSQESVTVTNLEHSSAYHFAVYEYNTSAGVTRYLTSSSLAAGHSTVAAPASGSTSSTVSHTGTTLTLGWQAGAGNARLVVVKEEGPVTGVPAALSVYPASPVFRNGTQLNQHEYVVFAGTGSSVTITGLTANKRYYYSIFEYNGSQAPVYNTTDVLSGNVLLSSTLPVTWAYFTAQLQQETVLLKWGTLQELQTAYFVIERNEGNGYHAIDSIPAAGQSTTPLHYMYTDRPVAGGMIAYRIRQADLDGRATYSAIATVQRTASQKAVVFPNPATDGFTVRVHKKTMLSVYDAAGNTIIQQPVVNNQYVDTRTLKAGLYYLVFQDGHDKQTIRLIKR